LHGLEEWSIATGIFTKSKDWQAIKKQYETALVLHEKASHEELRKVSGLGHAVRPSGKRGLPPPPAAAEVEQARGSRGGE
jgi:hypothetical protein